MPGAPPPFPLIDADPHAGRVLRFMRPSDYAWWAGCTAAVPATLALLEHADPTIQNKSQLRMGYRAGGFLGLTFGFLFSYQRSSLRFWGWTENQREQDLDMKEMSERARRGLPLYGVSSESPWIQNIAFRNSHNSQLLFHAVPWFNLVNHPYHGVDTSKYYLAAGVPVPTQEGQQ
ncbi:NADH-ubiquinone oxidoreductase complex I, 21 kDa subunit-domain-containing protein [Auriculariales sp. MPI-PUGE-AT-0066]|nr:NADH-ubiquinone oxidoreductase complex I, 21 kDa subunit-domain-containing protein [Auriculariales sp. MPI-PUGE-AT-0066]